ncbi:TPA: carbohydrate binding domain-containing protein [Klebsiella variicola subsp. variicola]|nr:carbohydrate binding domain-containing protein [Klebsiella variicola subsp. variicola]
MANNIIKGRKGGGSKQRTPTEQPDDLQSVAKAKILLALGEGEFAGGLTGKDIYLDGTPLENADGSQNFSGVSWEFRPGTQAQTYIQGIPGTENEISVGTEVSSKTAWTHTFTNTQLSAVRVRLKWPSLMKQEDDGDVVGNTVKYAIDLQTDGGAWQTVLETAVTGKTTSGYERSHRIDLPHAGSTWTLRLRKISPDANSVKTGDVMTLQSYTEVIDAKLRYPNTALLYIEFDSSQFNGSIPQISCEPRGRVIRVPDNYNPETREYTGVWTGGFKWAWTDNPAWIYYDIVTADRFGLGNRLSSANISKWTLYQIAQYCDQLVPDGRGGEGMEPRYTCNVYVQERNDAYTVLRDFAAIFRGMTCWNGEQIVVQADMPRDVDFTYTRANIVGKPRYSSSSSQVRYTNALVSWSDPDNAYADAMEPAFIPELVSRYSFNQLEMTAIGCTRQSEAHRKGLWGILTNNKDRGVEFDVGLDGRIPQPGYIIALADELLAGRVNGGRISAVNGRVITLDRDVDAKPGDRLQLNLPSGISQSRTIQAVNGRRQITVTTAYSETPERECVWAVESNDLFLQQYRVTGVKENGDATLTITGVSHDPDKFARIDTGAIIDQRPVSVLPAGNQSPPDDIVITSRSVVNQGISVETMQVNWSAVSGAIAYEAQWRRNDGNWINVPRSSTTSFEVSGIYAGRYLVRVRAINAAEISSGWAYSEEKTLTGKVGEPLAPLALATRSLVHGVQVSWEFPTGSGDTLRTELQYSKNQDGSAPMPLSDVAYPGKSYQQMGLSMGAEFWYRARLVDRLGNESPWTGWVQGMASDNFDDYYENLTDAIKDTAAWEETQRTISETQEGIRNTQQELEQTAEALRKEAEDQAKQVSQDIDASAKSITADVDGKISAVNKTITDEITSVNEALNSGLAQANKGVQEAKSAIADANKQIKTAENGLKQSLSQVNITLTNAVKRETADRIADVNAKAAQAADELLAARQGIEASIKSLTQVMKSADENLAREMSSLAAGANIQFDSQVIWHFNSQTTEGWTGSAGIPGVSRDGWLRPADSATDPYITSPGGLAVDGVAYRFIMLRFRKTGKPVWAGEIRWVSAGENFNNTKRYIIAEPEYADGVATLTVRDIPWTGNIDRIRLDLTNQQDASNFIEFDWIAVGRPAPGASTAALQDVRSTLSNALTAEAQARSTLAAQMRGSYEGSDLEKVTSGLLYQEKTARVTAISAEVKARESLQTQFNDNKAAVSGELSSLTTEQRAQASRIGGLETSLGKKADAAALTSLTQKVEQQGATLTSQGAALTSLTNRVGQTETGLAGTNEALNGLQSVVTRQGDRIDSQGQAITKLTGSLANTDKALAKKAEATALATLDTKVTQQDKRLESQSHSLTNLSNSLSQVTADMDARGQIPGNLVVNPSFERGLDGYTGRSTATSVVEVSAPHSGTRALKVDPGSVSPGQYIPFVQGRTYEIGVWVKEPGATTDNGAGNNKLRIGNSAGQPVFERPYNSGTVGTSWALVSGRWKATETASLPVTLSNYLISGSRYFDDFYVTDVTDRVDIDATAGAVTGLTNRVSKAEGAITSQSQQLTNLQNSLNTTNSNVSKKADATALTSVDNRVTEAEGKLTTQSQQLTNLANELTATRNAGDNLIPNFDFLQGSTAWDIQYPAGVTFGNFGDGKAGVRLNRTTNTSPGIFSNNNKPLPLNGQRKYRVVVKAKGVSGAMSLLIRRQNKIGQRDSTYEDKTVKLTTNWQTITWETGLTAAGADGQNFKLYSHPTNGEIWLDSVRVFDITDEINIRATSDAVSSLTGKVTNQGNTLTSQGQAITKLQGELSNTADKVNTKAEQVALNALTGRVEKTEAGLTAANSNIVSLTAAVNAGNAAGDDYIPNPSFDPAYDRMGYDVVETTADGVPADCPFRYAVRLAGRDHVPKINNIAVTPGDVFEMSALVACGSGSADFNFYIGAATTATGGIRARASGGNTRTTSAWKRATWRFTVPADTSFLRPFLQVNQSSPFGTVWYAADWHMRNVTAANSAQKTADATAKAVDSLTTTVSRQGDTLNSIGTRTTSLENSLRSTNDTVSKKADTTAVTQLQGTVKQQGNDIAAANSALTKLSSDLATTNANVNKKADASAMNTLQNQVTEQGKTLSAQGDSLTQLNNSLSQTAADIDASGKMPGNLIVNGSFERGAAGFTGWSSTATVADLQVPHSGNKALKMSAGQSNQVGQEISITQGRTYRMGVWAKQDPGTRIKEAGNTKFRVADSTGLLVGSNYGPFSSGWQLVTFDWKATKTTTASFQLTTFLSAGAMYFDDFHVLDVTDEKDIAANAGAISQMNTRVAAAEGAITTQAQQLTKLRGDLAVTNAAVSKKAEQSAVTGLTTRMTSAEGKLDSQSQSITSLTSTINTIRSQGANPWVDGTFESYSDGQVLGGSGTAVVVTSHKFTGGKSLKLTRDANNSGNSDKQLGTWQSVREDAKFRFEFWAMMPADQKPSSGWTTLVGIQSHNAAGQNAWQAAVAVSEASLGARDKWVKFTGIASNNGAGRTRAVVWISTRGATGNGTPGYSLYIDDLVITDVTDAKAAQDASDATASAVSSLTARVTDAEGKINAQAQQQTALATKVDNANSRVDNMAKSLSDSQSTQASLNTSLQSQIDAQAAANIKNQTTLDNTIKSVASITSTQQTHSTALEALATQQTTLTSSVGDLSASVQNTAKTVADVNGTVSSLWSMKVETVNGKKVGAGITLGSNGETSDMILYADRFSLFNRNNAKAVPVMIAEGNELYIDTARIKNSSLTTAKIADGSITNAKIGNEIRSNDFVDGSRGWRIAKDGSSQFNNVIVRGRVEANSGVFRGTVQADAFIGDIAVAKGYDSLTFRRNQTVQRNGAYQNRGYSMTVVLACTLVCQTYGTGSGLGYTSDITFNIGGQEVTRRIFVDAGNITAGTTAFELRFAARLNADHNKVGFFIKATGRNAAIDYTCTVENITAMAFRTNSNSFS